jgi:hypothetical protein
MPDKDKICDYLKLAKQERFNCIYLIYLSTIGQTGQKVYKFGRTHDSEHRFKMYPKNSTVIFLCRVIDCHFVEDELYKLFLRCFTNRTEYGREYFETDDVKIMINYMNQLIDHMAQRLDGDMVAKIEDIYLNWTKFRVHDDIPDDFSDKLIQDYANDKTDYTIKSNKGAKPPPKNIRAEIAKTNDVEDKITMDMVKRALYDKEKTLKENEKKLLVLYKKRAEILGIDYCRKLQKKKYEKYIIDDKMFASHYAFRLLRDKETIINKKLAIMLKNDCGIFGAKNLLNKIKLVWIVEKALGLNTFDIDTKRDVDRFDEVVVIDDVNKGLIKKEFRVSKADDKIVDTFECWIYQLIKMYKNVVSHDMFVYAHTRIKNINHARYTINEQIVNEHNNLSLLGESMVNK